MRISDWSSDVCSSDLAHLPGPPLMPAPARQRSAWRETVAGVAFGGYALIGRLATPLVHRYLRRRLAQGREEADRFGERLGRGGVARPAGPLLARKSTRLNSSQ